MSKICNQPTITGAGHINDMRSAIEHRATWFGLLWKESHKRGVDLEAIARAAIYNCGCLHGERIMGKCANTRSIPDFAEAFANEIYRQIFEMEIISSTDEEFEVHFHYCPLVAAWQKLGFSDAELALLCDIAMDGDRGIASKFEAFTFSLGETIAQGSPVCKITFAKK